MLIHLSSRFGLCIVIISFRIAVLGLHLRHMHPLLLLYIESTNGYVVCLKNPKNHIWYDSVMKDHIRHDKAVRWRVTLSVTINVYLPHRLCILYRHYGLYESVSGQNPTDRV